MAAIFSPGLIKRTVRECLLVLLAYAHLTACYQTLTRQGNARNPHQKLTSQAPDVGHDEIEWLYNPQSSHGIFEDLEPLDGPQAGAPEPSPVEPPSDAAQ